MLKNNIKLSVFISLFFICAQSSQLISFQGQQKSLVEQIREKRERRKQRKHARKQLHEQGGFKVDFDWLWELLGIKSLPTDATEATV